MIYVVNNEILDPVVESQVLRPLASDAASGPNYVIALVPIGFKTRRKLRYRLKRVMDRARSVYGVGVIPVVCGTSRWRSRLLDRFMLGASVRPLMRRHPQMALCGRNSYTTRLILASIRRAHPANKVVFDCRGDAPAECLGRAGAGFDPDAVTDSRIRLRYLAEFEDERAACEADHIIAVSQAMARMLERRHAASPAKITVRPCAVDLAAFPAPDPQAARRSLGVDGRFVVCYLGSLQWYQMPDQSARVFRLIQKHTRNALFLAITTEPDRMRSLLLGKGIKEEDFVVISVPSSEVSSLLPAADLGLLLRHRNPVNAVASPIKFAEYLACGVPVLITPGVGDYSGLVQGAGIGGLAELETDDDTLSGQLACVIENVAADPAVRRRCRSYVEKHLSWRK